MAPRAGPGGFYDARAQWPAPFKDLYPLFRKRRLSGLFHPAALSVINTQSRTRFVRKS